MSEQPCAPDAGRPPAPTSSTTSGGMASPTFCALPWTSLAASVDGGWGRCCVDSANYHDDYYRQVEEPEFALGEDSLGCVSGSRYARDNPGLVRTPDEAFDSPAMRRTRLAMLAGEPVLACSYCYDREAAGGRSYRQQMNDLLPRRIDVGELVARTGPDGSLDAFPCFLDLRFGNSCNLACIMCGWPTSSRWGLQQRVHWAPANIDPYRDDETLWQSIRDNVGSLRRVYFAGGEPFMQPLQFRLLDLLVESGAAAHVELVYTSNLTIVPPGIFEKFETFESVGIGASCDGTGETFERIRVGARWDTFVRNVDLFREHVDLWLQVAPQRENVAEIPDIVEFARGRGLDVDLTNIVQEPPELGIGSLPAEECARHATRLTALARRCRADGRTSVAAQLDGLVGVLQTAERAA